MLTQTKARLLALVALTSLVACGTQKEDTTKQPKQSQETPFKVDTADIDIKKVSEALGHFIGRNLNTSGIQFDMENVVKGIREGAAGKTAPMSDADYEKAMADLQQKAYNAIAEANLEASNKFMKENATAQGVIEIVPGKLQYTIIAEGQGDVVPEHGSPLINYTGKYLNGNVFGSSETAGGPITVPIDQTIPGFSKGIAGMKEGEKRRLFVHPEFGYGRSGQLPPDSLLIFDIEVVKAVSPEKEGGEVGMAENDLDDEIENQDFDGHSK